MMPDTPPSTPTPPAVTPPADAGGTLERNLAALSARSPQAAAAIAAAEPSLDLDFLDTPSGATSARLRTAEGPILLASARDPLREARRLADQADPAKAATIAVLGFGVGHHVGAIVGAMGRAGLVVCFEPDAGLLRAVLERVDCSAWLDRLVLVLDAGDRAALSRAARAFEGALALGVRIIAHPASQRRLGAQGERFCATLTAVLEAAKTTIVTTLVQTEKTLENLLANAAAYAGGPGVADLAGALPGVGAVVVSAGPSLAASLGTLRDARVRERACVIAAQTALRPLLAHGVRPHFVTALDHHDISRRFYEGLTAHDVRGVTLVAEPKANPAILDAWPGAVRLVGDGVLDTLLAGARGVELARHGSIPPGATVAHLSYFLARHLGCDPVVLVGQDLAYTGGLYYGAGAAIHHVWAEELGEFRTLEMMELERILRARHMVRRTQDARGGPLLTDEQMLNYLVQFEREFAADHARGLTTIDASGGARKAHADPMPLEQALSRLPAGDPTPPQPPPAAGAGPVAPAVASRLRAVARDARRVGGLARDALALVESLDAFGDIAQMNRTVGRIHAIRDKAEAIEPAFGLVQLLNQTGGLRRARSDRAIAIELEHAGQREVQAKRVRRDADNLRWLGDAADRLGEILDAAADKASPPNSTPTRTRTPAPAGSPRTAAAKAAARADGPPGGPPDGAALPAVIWVNSQRGGLWQRRDPLRPLAGGLTACELLLRTLSRCRRVRGVVLLSDDAELAQTLAGRAPAGLAVRAGHAADPMDARLRSIGVARRFQPAAFRGGLASLTVYDEALLPADTARIVRDADAPGAIILSGDWALADAALIDDVAARLLEAPDTRHVAFAQAPAGLGACALALPALEEIANNLRVGAAASIGGLVGYLPTAPRGDPIARPVCATVAPALRDVGRRLIPDSPDREAALSGALRRAADGALPPEAIAPLLAGTPQRPTHLRLACTGEPDAQALERAAAFARGAPDTAVTIDCTHAGYDAFADRCCRALRDAGAAVHVRTALLGGAEELALVTASPADVLSVDVVDPNFPPPLERLWPAEPAGMPQRWLVPRLRRDAGDAERLGELYDTYLVRYGAVVLEGAELDHPTDAPLPLPPAAAQRLAAQTRTTSTGTADTPTHIPAPAPATTGV